ncbi:axonemal dynein light intermediate polypeptide 1-like [Parambassis ranga]|uniref:Axonemal dynein light intermediate polypeptide 1 n=1 Tax=Parambassis ranga TaxID=210632 RepID=A0A6P7JY05_9TELE|nr:axonemal dynein light intermediate polypeptide 1-like [Parambassis ranga]
MIPSVDSLLKYDRPVLIKTTEKKTPKGRSLRVSPQPPVDSPVLPVPPKPKSAAAEAADREMQNILNVILPPREWAKDSQVWVQQVSSAPCTRADVIELEKALDTKMQQRQAKDTGICPVRRELYSQCFDELIRQVTINCAERGLLLLHVRDEIQSTLDAFRTLYDSSMAFGIRKALQAEKGKADMEKRIADLENEIQQYKKQLNEQEAQCDAIEKREAEKRQAEDKKHQDEIQFLKRANQQLKTQLEGIISSK